MPTFVIMRKLETGWSVAATGVAQSDLGRALMMWRVRGYAVRFFEE